MVMARWAERGFDPGIGDACEALGGSEPAGNDTVHGDDVVAWVARRTNGPAR
jgi:hypothetical protein